jgi:phosphate-selective porin OprO and OprP
MYTGANTPFQGQLVFDDGDANTNTDYTNSLVSSSTAFSATGVTTTTTSVNTNFGVAFRGDYKVFGDWAQNGDLTGVGAKKDFLDFGGGVDFSQGNTLTSKTTTPFAGTGATTVTTDTGSNVVRWTADGEYMMAKTFVLYAAVYGDNFNYRGTYPTGSDGATHSGQNNYGQVFEAGYFLTPAWELAGRYSITELDKHFEVAGQKDFNEIGAGVNYFLGPDGDLGNHARISFDANYLPNGSPSETGLGYSAEGSGKAEVVFRTLFQLIF